MYKRIVVKLGTSVLTGGRRHFDRPRMVELVRQCAQLHAQGHEIIVTSSGAVTMGKAHLNFPALADSIATRQLYASVGQTRLMVLWESFFDIYGIKVGQILLTRADVENRHRYLNARDVFSALIEQGIVPVVNENDAVVTDEIKVGDNDNLSALVATLTHADLLLMLTDQPGLYTADPRKNPDAKLINEVHHIDDTLRSRAGGTETGLGVGGMATKLEAANVARHAGADVIICSGSQTNVITDAVSGAPIGTRFPAVATSIESRKRWILAGPKPAGTLIVDDGASRAICRSGRSLLPAGIVKVNGTFHRGDTVAISNEAGRELARGIVAYGSDDLQHLIGVQSAAIEARLGYSYGPTIIHRNHMTLLAE